MDDLTKPTKPDADEFDLAANDNLLKAKAYVLFTMNAKGETAFNYDPSKLNEAEIIGFLTIAIDTMQKLRFEAEEDNVFTRGDDDICNECRENTESNDDD